MADFDQVQSIHTVANENDLKGVLQLKIAKATEPLTITCPTLSAAEEMADLIDGYCRLVSSGKESCWNRKGEPACNVPLMLRCLAATNKIPALSPEVFGDGSCY